MRLLLAVAVVLALSFIPAARGEDAAKSSDTVKITGVLVDGGCAENIVKKADPQKAADKHSKECTASCGEKEGYAIFADGKETKISADSKDMVKQYVSKEDSKMKVTVEGTKSADGSLKVTSITAAPAEG